jgi:hypothetical protein
MQQLLSRPALRGFAAMPFGMGAVTAQQGVQIGQSVATPVLAATLAPTIALTLGITVAAAIPIIGAAVALVGFAIEAIINSGCGAPCVVTTTWANQAEQVLQQNIAAYFAVPAPRPTSIQQAALAQFQAVWNSLVQQCNSPSLGSPGQRCITDRQAGACTWKQTAAAVPPWGTPPVGACWNWWNGYHDPIANDPDTVVDAGIITGAAAANAVPPTGSTSAASSAASSSNIATSLASSISSLSPTTLALAGGGLLLLLLLGGGD